MWLKRFWVHNRTLLIYVFVTYLDKVLIFLLPILVLYIAGDETSYNTVEYICSIANIIVPFLTFISSYAFYGYKTAENKSYFTNSYICYSSVSTLVVGALTLFIAFILRIFNVKGTEELETFIAIRTMFYLFVQYVNSYYRLIDNPVRSLIYSILINIASAITICLLTVMKMPYIVGAFFYPETLSGVMAVVLFLKNRHYFQIKDYGRFILESIKFAWPIVMNSTAVAFVANYGKVYAFNFLTSYEMYCLSFVLRIAMILQMAHTSVISFFSKDIYLKGYSKKFLYSYISIIGVSFVGTLFVLIGYNSFFARQVVPLNLTTWLVFLYTIIHMIAAALEINFGRNNKNIYIFIIASISCIVYLSLIFVIGVQNTAQLALYMVIYMLTYLILLIVTWRNVLSK